MTTSEKPLSNAPVPGGTRTVAKRQGNSAEPPAKRKLVVQTAGPVDKRRNPRGLTRKIKIAVDALMFDRCSREKAVKQAGITERALYLALAKPEVATYWNAQLQVLRTGERARNIFRLAELRDQDANAAAAVKAIQVLEQHEAENRNSPSSVAVVPGLVIVITERRPSAIPASAEPSLTIEHTAERMSALPLRKNADDTET